MKQSYMLGLYYLNTPIKSIFGQSPWCTFSSSYEKFEEVTTSHNNSLKGSKKGDRQWKVEDG